MLLKSKSIQIFCFTGSINHFFFYFSMPTRNNDHGLLDEDNLITMIEPMTAKGSYLFGVIRSKEIIDNEWQCRFLRLTDALPRFNSCYNFCAYVWL